MDHRAAAEQVLSFWFGNSTARDLTQRRRELWFVADASKRKQVDADVEKALGPLLQQAREPSSELVKAWSSSNASAREMLSLVIVLDQVSRHLYRGQDDEINACTREAVKYVRVALERNLDKHLRSAEFCFLILPLRHFLQRLPEDPACPELRSLLKLSGDERQDDEAAHSRALEAFDTATAASDVLGTSSNRNHITVPTHSDADVLEEECMVPQVEAPMLEEELANIAKDRVFSVLSNYLDERVSKGDDLFVSLSGGVDSMVIAKCLAAYARLPRGFALQARKKRRVEDGSPVLETPRHRVVAVHIDYGNRPESGQEADVVRRWCLAHGIHLNIKTITEIKRGVTPRDEYEKRSRALRYDAYRDAMGTSPSGIMFGHHQGDVQENVVSNTMKGANVLEISGMTPESIVEGVRVWRPLLSLHKDSIYAFARKHQVPWFKDTTPRWSTRGKLRNRLWPALGLVYGSGFGASLSSLAQQSDELHDMLRNEMFDPFWNAITFGKLGAWIPLTTPGLLDRPFFFWRHAMRHVCHRLQAGAIREQPIAQLAQLLQERQFTGKNSDHCRWIELRFQNPSLLFDNGKALCIFKELPNAPSRRGASQQEGFWQLLSLDEKICFKPDGPPLTFGPYRICVVSNSQDEAYPTLDFDLQHWVEHGKLEYALPKSDTYVPCPQYGRKIDFFRGADRKLRSMIPVLINADALVAQPSAVGQAVNAPLASASTAGETVRVSIELASEES